MCVCFVRRVRSSDGCAQNVFAIYNCYTAHIAYSDHVRVFVYVYIWVYVYDMCLHPVFVVFVVAVCQASLAGCGAARGKRQKGSAKLVGQNIVRSVDTTTGS